MAITDNTPYTKRTLVLTASADLAATLALTPNAAGVWVMTTIASKRQIFQAETVSNALVWSPLFQTGISTLVAGSVTPAPQDLTATATIVATCATPGGTQGILSIPTASRNAAANTFVINSSNGADTSTVEWLIVG